MARFVVHEHRAAHAHFDFRLEIGGALKSWAVPKGPSMNPAEKRLAIRVEDHPIEYLDFEGIIPAGMYGAGPVVVWDSGRVYYVGNEAPETAIQRGKLLFVLRGKKLRGGFALVRRARSPEADEWLLIKRRDRDADRGWHIKSALSRQKMNRLAVRVPPCQPG
jgi:bifunctional non-homologous end joining protein LigD